MEYRGFTVWFTGLPFTGKKKLAGMLSAELESLGIKTEILDGGKIRREFNQQLGYSKKDVYQNIRRICFESKMLTEQDIVAIPVTISPYKDLRDECRRKIERYIEVYCSCPMEILKKRDTKGLFEKAEEGKIMDVAGISAPFEEPAKPEVVFRSDRESYELGLEKILSSLQMLGYISKVDNKVLTDEEEEMIRQRLKDLGYI
jgi:adenylyl-sulfate kinase